MRSGCENVWPLLPPSSIRTRHRNMISSVTGNTRSLNTGRIACVSHWGRLARCVLPWLSRRGVPRCPRQASWRRRYLVRLRAQVQPPEFFRGGCSCNGLRLFGYCPNASQRQFWIARLHPITGQKNRILDQMQLVLHRSSSCSPRVSVPPRCAKAQSDRACCNGLLVREGESGLTPPAAHALDSQVVHREER